MEGIKISCIQERTEEIESIKLLKLRDSLYDKAKLLNNLVVVTSIIPIVYTIIVNNLEFDFFNTRTLLGVDELGVIISLIVSSIISILSSKINDYKLESNILRQAYDCKVFEIRGNKFIIPKETKEILNGINIDEKDKIRYAKWYDEEFTNNKYYDILICQVDNLLYTMYVYSKLKKTIDKAILMIVVFILLLISYSIFNGLIIQALFKVIVPISPIFAIVFTTWEKLKNNIDDYKSKMEMIREDVLKDRIDIIYLEAIQDKILINRLNDVLIPKALREHYLKPGNEYKIELQKFKNEVNQHIIYKCKI